MRVGGEPALNQARQYRPAYRREQQDHHDADQHIHHLLAGAHREPVPEIEQVPCVKQQQQRGEHRDDARQLQQRLHPVVDALLQRRIVAAQVGRQRNGFAYPARQDAGDEGGDADNRQRAHRGRHHKSQAVSGIENREQK